jgi:homoserine kinase
MRTVKVNVPASLIGLGTGAESIGLALGIHHTLTFTTRTDGQIVVTSSGETAHPATPDHPAIKAAHALFLAQARAFGVTAQITHTIPPIPGLGDHAALTVAGLVAANNLLDAPLNRDQLLQLGVSLVGQPAALATALFGGLTVAVRVDTALVFKRLEVSAQKAVIVCPSWEKSAHSPSSHPPALQVGRALLLCEALRKNDTAHLSKLWHDSTEDGDTLPGYHQAEAAARKAGAYGTILTHDSAAMIALISATGNAQAVQAEMTRALERVGVKVRGWGVNIDTQGVAVSVSG